MLAVNKPTFFRFCNAISHSTPSQQQQQEQQRQQQRKKSFFHFF